jgi:hypothetical protein
VFAIDDFAFEPPDADVDPGAVSRPDHEPAHSAVVNEGR